MILYFDRNGQLLEYLEYDDAARVGTTNFKIFAYFEGRDDYSTYNNATIRFKKPDLDETEYPDLFMVKHTLNYDPSIEASDYYSAEHGPYHGFIFSFDSIVVDDNEPVKLLDTPGIWEASITLQSEDLSNVTGLIRFTVESAVSDADDFETEVDASAVLNNIKVLLINDYVPYVGSSKDLDLGNRSLITDNIVAYSNENNFITLSDDDDYIGLNSDVGGYTLYSSEGATTTILNGATEDRTINMPDKSGTIALLDDITEFDTGVSIIANPLTNINGWVLTNYESNLVTINGYPGYKITRGNAVLTEETAKTYMKAMSGSEFLPVYDYDNPRYSYFVTADGEILKPQFDENNGLILYRSGSVAKTGFDGTLRVYFEAPPSDIGYIQNADLPTQSGVYKLITGSQAEGIICIYYHNSVWNAAGFFRGQAFTTSASSSLNMSITNKSLKLYRHVLHLTGYDNNSSHVAQHSIKFVFTAKFKEAITKSKSFNLVSDSSEIIGVVRVVDGNYGVLNLTNYSHSLNDYIRVSGGCISSITGNATYYDFIFSGTTYTNATLTDTVTEL